MRALPLTARPAARAFRPLSARNGSAAVTSFRKRASRLELSRRAQASSGRAARAPRRLAL